MLQFVNRLHDMNFIVSIQPKPSVFREEDGDLVHRELCRANSVHQDDLMIMTDIVDSNSGEILNSGIKVQINGGAYTYTPMLNYIPLSRFPIDADSDVRVPMKISDDYGHSIYAVCPIILYHRCAEKIAGKGVAQRIIEAMEKQYR